MKIKFPPAKKEPSSLSVYKNFPQLFAARKDVKLRTGIEEIIGAIATAVMSAGVTGVPVGAMVYGIPTTLFTALTIATTAFSLGSTILSMTSSKDPERQLQGGGILAGGRLSTNPVPVVYGKPKIGGNWAFWATSSSGPLQLNDMLHIVIVWGEGECEGIAKDIEQPTFHGGGGTGGGGTGFNDVATGGEYTGATYDRYRVAVLPGNNYHWTDQWFANREPNWTGHATPTPIPTDNSWIALSNGVKFKFKIPFGVTPTWENGTWWDFFAGDGVWLGNRLIYYYYWVYGKQRAWHSFHSGAPDQAVDAGLQSYVPYYANPHKNTCYSYFRLQTIVVASGMEPIWNSIPEFRITLKGKKILDPRYPSNPAVWSRNPALVWYDHLINKRYGMGHPTSRIDLNSIIEAATWCDEQEFYFDGAVADRKEALDNLDAIAMNFLGFRVVSGGSVKLKVWDDDPSVMTFSEFEKEVEIDPKSFVIEIPGIQEVPNTVRSVFANPVKNWGIDSIPWQDISRIGIDGSPKETQLNLIGTAYASQALQIAKFNWNRAKFGKLFRILAHPKCLDLEAGDMITVTHSFPNWTAKKLRTQSVGIQQGPMIPMVVMDEDSSIYDISVTLNADQEDPWNSRIFAPVIPVPTNVTLTSGADEETPNIVDSFLKIVWDWMDPGISYEIRYRRRTAAGPPGVWTDYTYAHVNAPPFDPSVVPPDVQRVTYRVGKLPCASYFGVSIRSYSSGDVPSDWSAEETITTWSPAAPDVLGIDFAVSARIGFNLLTWHQPSSNEFNVDKWVIYSAEFAEGSTTPPDFSSATVLGTKSRQVVSYRDAYPGMVNMAYWIQILDKNGQTSAVEGPQYDISPPDTAFLDFWLQQLATQNWLQWKYQAGHTVEVDLDKWLIYRDQSVGEQWEDQGLP
jgi:hypothetical protein